MDNSPLRHLTHLECREIADNNPYFARQMMEFANPMQRKMLEFALAQVPMEVLREPTPLLWWQPETPINYLLPALSTTPHA